MLKEKIVQPKLKVYFSKKALKAIIEEAEGVN